MSIHSILIIQFLAKKLWTICYQLFIVLKVDKLKNLILIIFFRNKQKLFNLQKDVFMLNHKQFLLESDYIYSLIFILINIK